MGKKISDLQLLSKLSAAVSYQFVNDSVCPSVLVSTLKNGKIYASIVRYGDFKVVDYSGVRGKTVICNTTAASVEEALNNLATKFLYYIKYNKREVDPLEALENHVKPDNDKIKLTLQVKEYFSPSPDWIDEG